MDLTVFFHEEPDYHTNFQAIVSIIIQFYHCSMTTAKENM